MSASETAPVVEQSRRGPSAVRSHGRMLRSELRLIVGRRRNQMGLLVLASVPVMIAIALKVSTPRRGNNDFITAATSNGMFVALAALTIEIALFLPLAVAVLSGDAIAGEANTGTLRYLLTVPVTRTRLLLVKYAALAIGAVIGVVVVVVVGVLIGGLLFGLGPVTLLSGTQVSLAEGLWRLVLAALYVIAGLTALAGIGLFVSVLTEQPIAAMIAVTIISTAMWILDGISQLDWLHPWLLVHYWPAFADLFRQPMYLDEIGRGLLVNLAYAVLFVSLAWARFGRKDITS
ncbi:MAG: ABC transporter permease subunit [Actinomycetales bacterium]|nr:ABC transporter permease subunit [Actinomycetales bacterium]